jgi:peptide/nickel transport system substrate-binding protein
MISTASGLRGIAVAGLLALLSACGGGEGGGGAAAGGPIVVGLNSDLDALNPVITTSYYAQEIDNHALFTPLIQYGANLEPVPWLAESWEMLGDTGIVFTLRTDVQWHDGQPVTAEDVKFTFDLAKDPDVASPIVGPVFLKDVATADVEGPNRIRFGFSRPHTQALEDFWWAPVPKHVLESVPRAQMATADFNKNPVGSGPFKLEQWIKDDRIQLVANPNFPAALGGPPASQQVIFRIIPEATTMITELLTGSVHIDIPVTPEQTGTVEGNPDVQLFAFPGRTIYYIGWNNARAPFTDPAVRRALAGAIDVPGIIAGLLDGKARAGSSTIPPGHPLYPSDVQPLARNVEDAKARLDAAGWKDANGDGIREKGGQPLHFTLITSSDAVRQSVAQAVQSQLKEIGADVELRVLEFQSMLSLHRDRDFDAILSAWTLDNFQMAAAPYALLHGSQAAVARSANRSGVKDPVLDSLIDHGARPLEKDQQIDVWRKLTQRIEETQPMTFLFWLDELAAARKDLSGVEMDQRGELHSIARWKIGP